MSITSVTDAIESVVKQVVEEDYDNQNAPILVATKPSDTSVSQHSKYLKGWCLFVIWSFFFKYSSFERKLFARLINLLQFFLAIDKY